MSHPPPRTIAAIEAARLLRWVGATLPTHLAALPKVKLSGQSERELWDERLPDRVLFELWAALLRSAEDPGLTVAFAEHTRLEDLGLFGLVLRTASNADEALGYTRRFQRLFTNSGHFEVDDRGEQLFFRWARAGARTLGLRLANEVAIAEQVALVRLLLGRADPVRVLIKHPAPKGAERHRRFFGCPVEWSAVEEGALWARQSFARPLASTDPAVRRFVEEEAARRLESLGDESLSAQVRDVLARRLVSGAPSLSQVAAALGLEPRRLRRTLAQEGHSVRGLTDDVRRETAKGLVEGGRHSITEIAFLLGLSETSAFSRAYRRWFGTAPKRALGSTRRAGRSSRGRH